MANKRFSTTELDFDAIKGNLIEYLKGQSQFSDYNFAGSSLNILLDILAYNTHYNSLYYNLALNEAFLDSASKRNSIVSHAKSLGYIPRSAKCASAVVTFSLNNPVTTNVALTLPKYSRFVTKIDNVDYNFYTLEDRTTTKNTLGNFVFENIDIYEGVPMSHTLSYQPDFKFVIPNRNVDSTTIVVKVQNNQNTGVYNVFNLATSISDVNSQSEVYFLKEVDNELLLIEFGNGVIGKQLDVGQTIIVSYLISNKEEANDAKSFTFTGSFGFGGSYNVLTVSAAAGGADVESSEEIRFSAPKYYASQNRAVTQTDYSTLIKYKYTNISSISVWGGENNTPPVYGKVFISIKPINSSILTLEEKEKISQDILKERNVVSITPVFVDPNYLNIEVISTIYFDETKTNKTVEDIKTNATLVIKDYSVENLNKFNNILRFSNFTAALDSSDSSVVSNTTKLRIHRPVRVIYGLESTYNINIENPIYRSEYPNDSIYSTGFYISGNPTTIHYLDDDGIGNIRLFVLDNTKKIIINPNIGNVDYAAGIVNIIGLSIESLSDVDFKLVFTPDSYDIVSSKNNVVAISDELININVVVDPSTSGGASYVWTSNR